MGDTVRYEVDGGVATIALDHPETRNALSDELMRELIGAFEGAREGAVHGLPRDHLGRAVGQALK